MYVLSHYVGPKEHPLDVGLVTYNRIHIIDLNFLAGHSRGVSAIDPAIGIFSRSSFIQVGNQSLENMSH